MPKSITKLYLGFSDEIKVATIAINIIRSLGNDHGDGNKCGKRNDRFGLAKQQLCKCITLFWTFLCRCCTATTWKCLISRSVEDVNTRDKDFLFLWDPELQYSLLEFNSRKICQHLTNWTSWNKRDKVWSRANFFKWRFRSRHRSCCLRSLLKRRS